MKKRKKPILPLTILVIALVAVGVMNTPRKPGDGHDHSQQPPAPTGESRENTPSVKDLKGATQAAVKTDIKPAPKAPRPGGPPPEFAPPSIERPKGMFERPKPNDSNISTQWYTEETKR